MPEGSDVLLNILIQCDNCSKSELTAAREVAGYCRSLRAKNNSEVCLGSRKPRACFKRFQRIRLIMQLSSTPDRVLGNDFICYRAENMVLSSEKGMCKLLHLILQQRWLLDVLTECPTYDDMHREISMNEIVAQFLVHRQCTNIPHFKSS